MTLKFISTVILVYVTSTVVSAEQQRPLSWPLAEDAPLQLAILANFPDPCIYFENDTSTWYVMATNNKAGILPAGESPITPRSTRHASSAGDSNIQIAQSFDFDTWSLLDAKYDPLPTPGAWAKQEPHALSSSSNANEQNQTFSSQKDVGVSNIWAPDFTRHPTDPSRFLLFYSAVSAAHPGQHCVGAAYSDASPRQYTLAPAVVGPYTPVSTPLACAVGKGGAIDPTAFTDYDERGVPTLYVAYKIDGNNAGHGGECGNTVPPQTPTPIMLQRMLLADGVTPDPAFEAVQILDRTHEDGPLVEAPALVKVGRLYFLFYSSGCTRSPSYDVRFAYAEQVTGPYKRAKRQLIKTGDWGLEAPGSVSVKKAGGRGGGTNSQAAEKTSAVQRGERARAEEQNLRLRGRPGTVLEGWRIALHARVHTNWGGIRAMFTAGLRFTVYEESEKEPLVELVDPEI